MTTASTRGVRSLFVAGGLAAAVCGAASPAHAVIVTFTANLDGPSESPANASPGTGHAQVDYDTVAHTMRVQVSFSGLIGTTTASHIHSATAVPLTGTAIVATQTPSFTGFPLGVTAGTMDTTFDMTLTSSYNAAFLTAHGGTPAAAEPFFFTSLGNGTAYLNIHSTAFPGGEIRGFLAPTPGTAMIVGLGGLLAARRRRG